MKKQLTKLMVSALVSAMILTSLPVNMLSVHAKQATESEAVIETTKSTSDNDVITDEAPEMPVSSTPLPVYQTTVENMLSGTIGDNNGFHWSYDESTATLTVTGEDSGLQNLRNDIPEAVMENARNVVFRDCVASGSLCELFYSCSNLTSADMSGLDTSQVTDMRCMFAECHNLTNVNLNGLDTSHVTNMKWMFLECSSLTSLDVSGFDTSLVTDMACMFAECRSLTSLDVSGFDTSQVTSIGGMFERCLNLSNLDVSGFDTSQVTSMNSVFYDCNSLTSLDVSGFDTSQVTDMKYMFNGCSSLTSLDVSGFDTSQVTNMARMFYDCSSLTVLDVSGFDTSRVTNMELLFYNCSALTRLDVSSFDTCQVTNMRGMFSRCHSLTSLDVSNFDTCQVTNMGSMFTDCMLTDLNLSNFDTSQVTFMASMFNNCHNLTTLDLSNFDTSQVKNMTWMFLNCSSLTNLDLSGFDTSQVKDMNMMFRNCSSLTSLDLSSFDTGQVTDMHQMFSDCSSLTNLDLSGFDTSQVTDMSFMFSDCSSLTSLDLNSFDTSQVTNMVRMFYGCKSLTGLDLNSFDTSQVTDMCDMFYGCRSLTSLDFGRFDTGRVTDMSFMFCNCSNLTSVDLNDFNTGNVTDMRYMFYGCSSLTSLDLSDFDTTQVVYMIRMFYDCSSLTSLDLSSFDARQVVYITDMFTGCTNLQTIRTFKAMWDTLSINFLKDFYDEEGNPIMSLTSDNCNKTLVKKCTYTITYELDGGINSPDNPATYTNLTDTFLLNNPTRTGYTFDGWYNDSSFSEEVTAITKGSSDNKTLYAKWIANKYTITFDANGGEGVMTPMNDCVYDNSFPLMENQFHRTGYVFDSWNTKPDGSGESYKNAANVKNLVATNGGSITLYAQWKKASYKITYQLNGGTNSAGNPVTYTDETDTFTLKSPTKNGYTFAGWYNDSAFSEKVTAITKGSSGDRTLYAKWSTNKYTVKFDANGGKGTMTPMKDRLYDKSYALNTNRFKRTGYTFNGWNTKKNGSGKSYKDAASVKNLVVANGKSITLYAQWKAVSYKITYKLNGGKNNAKNPKTYTITKAVKTLKKPTRTGYTFKGWYSNAKLTKKVTGIAKGSTGNKTLYAKWTPNKYTVKFDGNGATEGKMSNLKNRKYGTSYQLTPNTYEKEGYKFVGWNTRKNGKGTAYRNKAKVKNLTAVNGKTITLYAQWEKK